MHLAEVPLNVPIWNTKLQRSGGSAAIIWDGFCYDRLELTSQPFARSRAFVSRNWFRTKKSEIFYQLALIVQLLSVLK